MICTSSRRPSNLTINNSVRKSRFSDLAANSYILGESNSTEVSLERSEPAQEDSTNKCNSKEKRCLLAESYNIKEGGNSPQADPRITAIIREELILSEKMQANKTRQTSLTLPRSDYSS